MNLSGLSSDFYEFTMGQGFFNSGIAHKNAVFDVFFRKNPFSGGYTILSGVTAVKEYLDNLHFTKDDIEFLEYNGITNTEFHEYLLNFKWTGSVYAIDEGSVVFPNEPLIRIEAPLIDCHIVEANILSLINFNTLIATKARRIIEAAETDPVMDFGLRRAQTPYAGLWGSRAAFIGGVKGTSNTLAGKEFDIPVMGTHSHSWVQSFNSEYDSFMTFADQYWDKTCILLIDTYDVLNSGIPNAIRTYHEMVSRRGLPNKFGVRLDSGDLAYLSKKVRKALVDEAIYNAVIVASNDLDEYSIQSLKTQKSEINSWGVGTNLITGGTQGALGAVYKLAMLDGQPIMKFSENIAKRTTPGKKAVVRFTDINKGKYLADLIVDYKKVKFDAYLGYPEVNIQDELDPLKTMTIKENSYKYKYLLKNIKLMNHDIKSAVYQCENDIQHLWDEYKRLDKPHVYKVDLDDTLIEKKKTLAINIKKSYSNN